MALQSGQLTAAITAGQLSFQLTNLSANAQSALPSIGAVPQSMGVPVLALPAQARMSESYSTLIHVRSI